MNVPRTLSRLLIFAALMIAPRESPAQSIPQIASIAGTGEAGYFGDGGPATEAQLNNPYGLTTGPDGALYICDMENHRIRRIARDGKITTVAGCGKRGYAGDGGPALQAELNEPYEVRWNLFFVEMRNNIVRRVELKTGRIDTLVGTGKEGFAGDGGPAARALLRQPHSIQFDGKGDLYICDIGNNRIRMVTMATGIITTLAGTGEKLVTPDGAHFATAPLNGPRAIDFDRAGNMWLALREGNAIYRLNLIAGTIHHVAGTGKTGFSGNGGPAREAALSGPKGLSIAPNGDVYFADTESHSIRKIDVRKGTIEGVAGTGESGAGSDGDPMKCKLARPHGIHVDARGTVYIADSENQRVRLIR